MTVTDWVAVGIMAAALVVTVAVDRVIARRQNDPDADRRSRTRLRRELERQP